MFKKILLICLMVSLYNNIFANNIHHHYDKNNSIIPDIFSYHKSYLNKLYDNTSVTSLVKIGIQSNNYFLNTNFYTSLNLGKYLTNTINININKNNKINITNNFIKISNFNKYPLSFVLGKNTMIVGSFLGGGNKTASLNQLLFQPSSLLHSSLILKYNNIISYFNIFTNNDWHYNFSYSIFFNYIKGLWKYSINGGYIYNLSGTGNTSFIKYIDKKNFFGCFNFDYTMSNKNYAISAGWAQTSKKYNFKEYAGSGYIQLTLFPEINNKKIKINLSYNKAYNTNNIKYYISSLQKEESIKNIFISYIQIPFINDHVLISFELSSMDMYNKKNILIWSLDTSIYF